MDKMSMLAWTGLVLFNLFLFYMVYEFYVKDDDWFGND